MAHVLLTREDEDATPFLTALTALGLGLDLIEIAMTTTRPPPDPDALARALRETRFDAIMLASMRGAYMLLTALEGIEQSPAIWAVGPATASVIAENGQTALLPIDGRDAKALAKAILAAHPLPLRVLVPRAADGRDEGLAILRAGGAEVVEVVAYRTVPIPPSEFEAPHIEAIVTATICIAFAPSQVNSMAEIIRRRYRDQPEALRAMVGTQFVAIGKTTAAALRELGAQDVAVAETPTPAGIANAVASVYPRRR